MYKDKDKQREAVKKAVEKHRKGITEQGITREGITLHTGPKIKFDNGSYLHINKLVDIKSRGLITYLVENLNSSYQGSIRVGVFGPTIKECKKLLEVTA